MTDVFAQLPRFSWRGTEYPVLERTASFAHENARHHVEYQNGALVETTGAHNLILRYKLALREDIAKGPYRRLFQDGYTQLFIDTRNREPGALIDPVLGELQCVPTSWNDTLDVQKRDGTDVEVEFEHAPEIGAPEVFNLISLEEAEEAAKRLDEEIERILADEADLFEGTGEPTADLFDTISGVGAQAQAQTEKFAAGLENYAFKLEKIERQIEAAENPRLAPMQRAVRRNRDVSTRLAKRGSNPAATVKRVKANYDRTIAQAAADVDMSIEALIKANPILAKVGYVPIGTVLITKTQRATPI